MTIQKKGKKQATPVSKPFLTGSVTDGNTLKNSLKFLGSILLVGVMGFFVCSVTGFDSLALRIPVNALIVIVILYIFYNTGINKGADAVTHGEILYQRDQKGLPVDEKEKKLCFHKAKGFAIGFFGILPLFLIAVYFSFNIIRQTTDSGVLPSWMQSYTNRAEIGGALVNYTQPESMTHIDAIRILMRILLMPFVSLIGSTSREGMFILERLSPIILLLPVAAYGIGYMNGRGVRTQIHTSISENEKKRVSKARKLQKRRMQASGKREPEQLN